MRIMVESPLVDRGRDLIDLLETHFLYAEDMSARRICLRMP